MAESGVKTPLNTALRTQNDTPGFINMAQVIQANLKPLGFERGLNRLWTQGGLMYSPPIR